MFFNLTQMIYNRVWFQQPARVIFQEKSPKMMNKGKYISDIQMSIALTLIIMSSQVSW